ncbi:phage baseplate assembly protein V [Halodesulfovibrio marinisediminis]|uniref:Phage baseplate assembly protein V n=1 Tax=Halodesulfovibrio marinisediminis DSM 17456 TaxID=1121457 RepID=A0A1N6I1E4_9BACT|nr:phage baseplate assembly protein V [Halodesulfovibrio marinisediminis]SIO25841.1 phage baseplate assembly protein V [Halodesulfovibrio marinisediminis DSM 17456]
MSYQLAELYRQVNNLVRIGTVHSVDYERNMARVAFGAAITDYLPWLTTRAAGNRTYESLEVGEQVFVITPPGQALGVIVGVLNQNAYPHPAQSPEIQKTVFKDGSVVMYDRASHVLTADIKGDVNVVASGNVQVEAGKDITATAGKAVEIAAGSSVTVTAKNITLNGQTTINGSLSQGGGSNGGSASFNSTLHTTGKITTDSDVVARVSLNSHNHTCREGNTGSPA